MEAMRRWWARASGTVAPGPPLDVPLFTAAQTGPWPYLPGGTLALENGGTIELPADGPRPEELPLGYHRFEPSEPRTSGSPDGLPTDRGGLPGPVPTAPTRAHLGLVGAAVRHTFERQLGHRRFRRSSEPGRLGWGQWSRLRVVEPLERPGAWAGPRTEPLFPQFEMLPEPPLHPGGRGTRSRRHWPGSQRLPLKAKALNAERLIDRTKVWAFKSASPRSFVRTGSNTAGGDDGFEQFIRERGKVLDGYTSFCSLAERFGLAVARLASRISPPRQPRSGEVGCEPRRAAPASVTTPGCSGCAKPSSRALRAAATFCATSPSASMGEAPTLGSGREPSLSACACGAPPDDFNTTGQNWGLPPWDPWKLRAAAYEPFIETLRAVLRPASGLRVDHVMGLFRLFWVPLGSEPAEGTYVRYPWHDMVALLRLEATRAGAYIVGEDLGTVEDHVRDGPLGQRGAFVQPLLVRGQAAVAVVLSSARGGDDPRLADDRRYLDGLRHRRPARRRARGQ